MQFILGNGGRQGISQWHVRFLQLTSCWNLSVSLCRGRQFGAKASSYVSKQQDAGQVPHSND